MAKRKQQGTFIVKTDYQLKPNEFGWWSVKVNGIHNIKAVYGGNNNYLLSIIKRHIKEVVNTVELSLIKKYKKA